MDFSFKQIPIGDLPLYSQDDDANQADSVKRLKADVSASQGLLFVTPEYNRSMPGVLKDAIDHASRPHGQNASAGKPAGVLGASVGAVGTAPGTAIFAQCSRLCGGVGAPEAFTHAKDGLFDETGDIGPDIGLAFRSRIFQFRFGSRNTERSGWPQME